ncbi:MAG: molecular chaperone HtpG [Eubacteriales bacterium]|nr:molecular chaperone HtpG [Eubacteriales bacterium]
MKQFKTESKRILDLMINSIYTNKEIFLRELISNASDAIDKLHFISLTDSEVNSDFKIKITIDKDARTLTIEDNGIGMNKEDLEKNLGTIAESGTLDFKEKNEEELIGQFGVGFYSAFMVSDKIEVLTKKYKEDKAYLWTSKGVEGYEIKEVVKDGVGSKITLTIKQNSDEENYDEYLQDYVITSLIKKHSDYIHYPIKMDVKKTKEVDGKEETFIEEETINSMVPLWRKNKNEVTTEAMESFYMDVFHDYEKPLKCYYSKIEGKVSYNAMLFVPQKAPFDYYSKDFKRGLKLYCNGVLIMDKCEELLPDYFGFVAGIVDSSDLSLNISREILQKDRQVKQISSSLEKKIITEFKKWLEEDRESYAKMFAEFGQTIKFGIYNSYGMKADELKDLLLFYSSKEKKEVTLKEYVSNMNAEQKEIYYATGDSIEQIDALPLAEKVKDKGFEILYLKDKVDEFVVKMIGKFEDKEFKSIADGDLGLDSEEEKKEIEDKQNDAKPMIEELKEALGGKVEIKLTNRLKSYPACVTAVGDVTLEMEKLYRSMPHSNMPKVEAEKQLEINVEHPIYSKLESLYQEDKEKAKKLVKVLYYEGLLLEGLPVENVPEMINDITDILV